jgi:hypothetical protein
LAQRFRRVRAIDGDAGELRGRRGHAKCVLRRRARIAPVEREDAEQLSLRRSDRRCPADLIALFDGEVAVVLPDLVGRDVGGDDLFAMVCRDAAGGRVGTDRDFVDGGDELRMHRRGASDPQREPVVVDQVHRAVHAGTLRLVEASDRREHVGQLDACGDGLEHASLPLRCFFGTLPVGDVADHDREVCAAIHVRARDAEVHGEGGSIAASPRRVPAAGEHAGLFTDRAQRVLERSTELARGGARNQLQHRPADRIVGRVAEHALGGAVEHRDVEVVADNDDRVHRRIHDRREPRLRLGALLHSPEMKGTVVRVESEADHEQHAGE